ncbi:MAG: hypothetical protein ACE5LB_14465 [Acidiferrobacterales bacterium]
MKDRSETAITAMLIFLVISTVVARQALGAEYTPPPHPVEAVATVGGANCPTAAPQKEPSL